MNNSEIIKNIKKSCEDYSDNFYKGHSSEWHKRDSVKLKIPEQSIERPTEVSFFSWIDFIIIFVITTIIISIIYFFSFTEFFFSNVIISTTLISILLYIIIYFRAKVVYKDQFEKYTLDKVRFDKESLEYTKEYLRVKKLNTDRVSNKDFYDRKADKELDKIKEILLLNPFIRETIEYKNLSDSQKNIIRLAVEDIRNYDLIKNVGYRPLDDTKNINNEKLWKDFFDNKTVSIYCPKCGNNFKHILKYIGKTTGIISGGFSGAIIGAKTGIVAGPLGGIAGTVPGFILGAIFGIKAGNNFDKPICPKCNTKFSLPDDLLIQ